MYFKSSNTKTIMELKQRLKLSQNYFSGMILIKL